MGINRVERLLGRELCVLAWAVENAPRELLPNAVRNWVTLRPEERWWLFSMAGALTGTSTDVDVGWRKAIRIALTEAPSSEDQGKGGTVRAFRGLRDTPQINLFPGESS